MIDNFPVLFDEVRFVNVVDAERKGSELIFNWGKFSCEMLWLGDEFGISFVKILVFIRDLFDEFERLVFLCCKIKHSEDDVPAGCTYKIFGVIKEPDGLEEEREVGVFLE